MRQLFKKGFALFVSVHLVGISLAQNDDKVTFTLEEAITYAIQHNAQVKNERLNQKIAKAQVGETTAQGLPQINANGNITYNPIVQTNFIDASNFGGPENTYMPFQMGLGYQSSVAISASQMLFNGSYFVGLRAAKVYKELAEKGIRKAEIDVAEGVALAYYGSLVAEERAELLKANQNRLDSLFKETKAMNEQGFVEGIDVKRLQVNLNNVKTEYENVLRSLRLNLDMLKFQMGLPVNREIEISQSIDGFDLQGEFFNSDDFVYHNRIEYQQLQVNRELAELDVKNNKVQYYPTLNAFANYGYNAAKNGFGELFESTRAFVDQEIKDVATWNDFASVGLELKVPIFDGFLKANRIRKAKLVREQVVIQIQNLKNSIELEINQALINLQNSLQSLESEKENIELAEEVYRITKIKYQEGVGSNLEVIEAENAFKTAETNYFNALYNALVARVAYQKATGTLLNNNN